MKLPRQDDTYDLMLVLMVLKPPTKWHSNHGQELVTPYHVSPTQL